MRCYYEKKMFFIKCSLALPTIFEIEPQGLSINFVPSPLNLSANVHHQYDYPISLAKKKRNAISSHLCGGHELQRRVSILASISVDRNFDCVN